MADQTNQEQGRPMGYMERMCVSSANVGRPATLGLLASLPASAQEIVTEQTLLKAINHLLDLHPLLRAAVVDGRTRTPSWKVQPDLDASRVLELRKESAGPPSDELLLAELVNLGNEFDGSRGPLWRVIYYQSSSEPKIGLSIAHVLSDGLGARNLFSDLLSLLRKPDLLSLSPPTKGALAPSWDTTVDLTLKTLPVLQTIWGQVTMALWSWWNPSIKRFVPSAGPFPDEPSSIALLRFDSSQVVALKAFAKQHGIGTLQPLLHGAVLASCFLSNKERLKSGVAAQISAISYRDSSSSQGRIAGNYSGAFHSQIVLSAAQPFTELCKSYARELADPRTKQRSLETLCMLKLLGDPDPEKEHFTLNGKSYPQSALEKLRLSVASGETPIPIDVGTSNLMKMDETGWEEEKGWKLAAAKNVGVSYAPLVVVPISDSRGEMAISVSWQDHTLEEGKYVKRFLRQFEAVLGRLVSGGVGAEATIDSLRVQ